jgi:hypothetical protein
VTEEKEGKKEVEACVCGFNVYAQTHPPEYLALNKAIRNWTKISRIVAIIFVIALYPNMTLWNL